ncbi:gliding motility lipoprotein GldD [Zunongwangia sp.]|uniref:gliding motility lipoprotein GldD n=1 Tax=Zunongwangia sp. TaxID=1965325 RepID=UPI003AA82525
MRLLKFSFVIFSLLFLTACQQEVQPKPNGFLALKYPKASYKKLSLPCPYVFEKNTIANISYPKHRKPCWFNVDYPLLNASVFITYQPVKNNLDSLLADAQKLPLEHTIKADAIEGDIYTNPGKKVYGMFYELEGDAASQAQFYITDSVHHFLTGALYFKALPNYDSIYPAAAYIQKDIKHLMESVQWQ